MKVSIKENLVVRKNGVGNLLLNFLFGWFGLCPMTNKNNYVNDTDFYSSGRNPVNYLFII